MTGEEQNSAAVALRCEAQRLHSAARVILADGDNLPAGVEVLKKAIVNLEITINFINEKLTPI